MILLETVSWVDLIGVVVLGQFFQALLGGFSEASRGERARQDASAARTAELESKILLELAQSPDKDIQALALTGLLSGSQTQAKGKKGASGLGGFITEIQGNPTLPALAALLQTPAEEAVPAQPDVEGFLGSSGATVPLEPQTAAQAPRGTVEGVPGQSPVPQLPPFQALAPTTPNPTPVGEPIPRPTQLPVPGPGGPVPQTEARPEVPRQVFPGPEQAGELAAAERGGIITGVLEALNIDPESLTDEENKALARGALGAPQGASQAMNVIFEDGTPAGRPGTVLLMPGGELVDATTGDPITDPVRTFVPDAAFTSRADVAGRVTNTITRADGTFKQVFDRNGRLIFEVPADPSSASDPTQTAGAGTRMTESGEVVNFRVTRGGELIDTGPAGNQPEPQSVARARSFLTDVDDAIAELSLGNALPPSPAEINAIVQDITEGEFATRGALMGAAQRGIQRPREFQSVVPGQPVEPEPSTGLTLDGINRRVQENRDALTPQR